MKYFLSISILFLIILNIYISKTDSKIKTEKQKMIDAIAYGAKLTKSDAG